MALVSLKNIEKSVKKFLKKLFLGHKTPKLINEASEIFNGKNIKKILLLRHDRIGDLVVSRPFIHELRKALPNSRIDVLLSRKNHSTSFFVVDFVDNVYLLGKRISKQISVVRQLRKERYDLVIDLLDNESLTSSILLKYIKGKNSLGFAKENSSSYDYIVPIKDKKKFHVIDRLAHLLLPFGIDAESLDINLHFPLSVYDVARAEALFQKKEGAISIGIVVSGSDDSKFFGEKNLTEIIGSLNEKYPDFDIVLFGEKRHHQLIDDLNSETNSRMAKSVSGLRDYAMMLSRCDFLILPDTAAVHFASALGIPSLVAFKQVRADSDHLWTPYKSKFVAVKSSEPSLSSINSEEIISAFDLLYSQNKPG